jgi:hypothetical protein
MPWLNFSPITASTRLEWLLATHDREPLHDGLHGFDMAQIWRRSSVGGFTPTFGLPGTLMVMP